MLDWLIVGGGIHGTTLSFFLTRLHRGPMDRVQVLDPHEQPLALWNTHTRNTGMDYLRSPHVQSLDRDPWSISTFAKTKAGQPLASFIPTHNRPSLALFRAHSDWMVGRHQLDRMRVQGRAQGLERIGKNEASGWRVRTEHGDLESRNVILAMGATEQPTWPDWASDLKAAGGTVQHIFERGLDRTALPNSEQVVVIGGGITAAQLALALAEDDTRTVTLLMRHAPRQFPFDSDLCWIGGDCYKDFGKLTDYGERRRVIQRARHRGSIPADVYAELQDAIRHGRVALIQGSVTQATALKDRTFLHLDNGQTLAAQRVVLATGFDPRRPGGDWLDTAVEQYAFMTAADGYPIPNASLAWAEGLYVSGPLAELEIGPVSRNIIGARMAAERIGRAVSP